LRRNKKFSERNPKRVRYRSFRITLTVLLGWLALFIQMAAAGVVTLLLAIKVLLGPDILIRNLSHIWLEIAASLSAILWFPLITVPIYLMGRGISASSRLLSKSKKWGIWSATAVLLGIACTGIPSEVGAASKSITLGIALGMVLDLIRRAGSVARRERFALKKENATKKGKALPVKIKQTISEYVSSPWSCPILPDGRSRVFISYTHSSPWAHKLANELFDELKNNGAECFLDQHGIKAGSSWKRQLHLKMVDANAFIAVMDELSINKDWPAAEMETALAGKFFTGQPEIIILAKHGELFDAGEEIFPVFEEIFNASSTISEDAIRLIEVKENTAQSVAFGLTPGTFHAAAVFPPLSATLLLPFRRMLARIGLFGTMLGPLCFIAALLHFWNKVNLNRLTQSKPLLYSLFLLGSFWLGFTLRSVLAFRYELNDAFASRKNKYNFASACGFIGILAICVPQIPLLWVGWAIAIGIIGFFSSSYAIKLAAMENKDFLRQS
jgi:hypothetical protein